VTGITFQLDYNSYFLCCTVSCKGNEISKNSKKDNDDEDTWKKFVRSSKELMKNIHSLEIWFFKPMESQRLSKSRTTWRSIGKQALKSKNSFLHSYKWKWTSNMHIKYFSFVDAAVWLNMFQIVDCIESNWATSFVLVMYIFVSTTTTHG